MKQPEMAGLLETVDSRYTLVVAAARRARQLMDGDPQRVEVDSHKPITVALREIAAGEVEWRRGDSSATEAAGESGDTTAQTEPQPTVDAPEAGTEDNDDHDSKEEGGEEPTDRPAEA